MDFQKMSPFFDAYSVWNDGKDLDWYEVMWDKVLESGLLQRDSQKEPLIPYFYASVLIDFYRSYISDVAGEYWDEENLTSEYIPEYSYKKMCKAVGVSEITLLDLMEIVGDELLSYPLEDLDELIEENTPNYSEMYYRHVYFDYQNRLFSALRQHFSVIDMFILMTYTFYNERFSNGYREDISTEEEDKPDFSEMNSSEQFISLAHDSAEFFYGDQDLSRGLEWVSAVYS